MAKKKQKTTVTAKRPKNNFKGKLSLVIPCYNESSRLKRLLKKLQEFEKKWAKDLEVILVDDGSTDDSVSKINSLFTTGFSERIDFKFIPLEENVGKGGALKAGVAEATGDYILTLDADFATNPSDLLQWQKVLPGKSFSNNEIYIGSREHEHSEVKGQPLRRLAGLIYNFIIQLLTNLNLNDTQCGFKLYPRDIAHNLFSNMKNTGWAHDIELLYQAKFQGIPINMMPIKWEHQEDSKISLISDSFKMAFATAAISTRLNWNWFVKQPLQSLSDPSLSRSEPAIFRLLFFTLAVLLFFAMPLLSFDFGITGDEELQKVYGEKILSYFETDGEDDSALNYKNLYYYGGLFDYCAAWLNAKIGGFDPYDMRHMLNAFVGFLMMLFTGLLAKELSNSWRVAFFALLLIVLSPRIFGHSMNNPKDIPFAAAYVFSALYLIRFMKELPRPSTKTIVFLTLGIAASINVRVGGILLIAYFGLFTGVSYLWKKELREKLTDFPKMAKVALKALIVIVGAYFLGMLYWPYAQQAPLSNPLKALSEMSNFSTSIRMLFEGEHLWSDELPWYYIPKWIAISAPVVVLAGLAAFLAFFGINFKKIDNRSWIFTGFIVVFPIGYAIYKESSLYDGMRHFLFVYPILAVLAAYGWEQLIQFKDSKGFKMAVQGVLILLFALPAVWMIKNHPYQYLYFNELAGGVNAAYGKYETDYWMNSMKGLCEWLVENDDQIKSGEEVKVITNCAVPVIHYMKNLAPNVKVYYSRFNNRNQYAGKYYLYISRFLDRNFMLNGAYPMEEVVYTENVGDIVIGAITKRNGTVEFDAYQAEKNRNLARAASLYAQELKTNPKNDVALLGRANAFINQRQYTNAKPVLDSLLALSETNVNSQYSLGLYHFNSGDRENAKKTFERIKELNYKFNASYYYLASIYAQENDFAAAMENIEGYDKENGNIAQAYDMGIQIAQQLNAKHKELFFQAKKAYLAQDGTQAYQLLNQSLAMNSTYAPAVRLKEAFDKAIAQQQQKQ